MSEIREDWTGQPVEAQPKSPTAPREISRGAQTAWIVASIMAAAVAVILYLHFANQPETFENCWTQACRDRVYHRAMEQLRGY